MVFACCKFNFYSNTKKLKALMNSMVINLLIIMLCILFCAVNFYYIAFMLIQGMGLLNNYKSELYLYSIAQNVGFLKRFYGL